MPASPAAAALLAAGCLSSPRDQATAAPDAGPTNPPDVGPTSPGTGATGPGTGTTAATTGATGPTGPEAEGIFKLDHLIFIVQENRSFDHYWHVQA
jgi:phospholipase C